MSILDNALLKTIVLSLLIIATVVLIVVSIYSKFITPKKIIDDEKSAPEGVIDDQKINLNEKKEKEIRFK